MDSRIIILCFCFFVVVNSLTTNCPVASRIASCSPKCSDNSNCRGAQICCTNICGTKSCTDMNQYQNGNKNDKYSSQGATGSYCGNTKCSPQEKCEMDKTTKRQKCVRG